MIINLKSFKYSLVGIMLLILISNEATLFSDIFNLFASVLIGFIDFKLKDKLAIIWPVVSFLFMLAIIIRFIS
jgi:hypothetical protein